MLVVTGIAVFVAADRGAPDFGWSSYAPLEQTQGPYESAISYSGVTGTTVLWTGQHLVGAGLLVLGLLVLTGVRCRLLGRRAGRRGAPEA